jgi:hypothetical protein
MPTTDISIHDSIPPQRIDKNGFNVRDDVLYTDAKGRTKNRLPKRADDALESLGEVLRRVLEPNETIFYIAKAQAMPGFAAQIFGGAWHVYSLPNVLLFFTERRIVAFRMRKRMGEWAWDRGIRTVRWGDLQDAKAEGFLSQRLTLKFRNGERQVYWRFASGDLQKAKLLVGILRPHGTGETTSAGAMVSLCPACLVTLSPGTYLCQSCGLKFKDEGTLVRRGILIPGGASFYVGATGLGVIRAIAESFLILLLLVFVMGAIAETAASQGASPGFAGALFILAILALDKGMAVLVSRQQVRDFLPVS